MKKQEPERTVMPDAELDAALAQMAEEVPPMPGDFHERWMNAVRADAQNAVPAEESAPGRIVTLARWTRILSVAAVFVFLIGGTLIYRNTKKTLLSAPYAAEKREAAEYTAEKDTGTEEEAGAQFAAEEPASESRLQGDAGQEAAKAAGAEITANASTLKTENAVQNLSAASIPAENAEEEADYAMEDAEYDTAPVYEAAEEAAATMMPTSEPTAVPTPVPTAAPAPAEEPASGQTGILQEAGIFFADMGDFLLAALPYLAVLAVPAAAALIVRRRKARKR